MRSEESPRNGPKYTDAAPSRPPILRRSIILILGIIGYLIGLGTLLYMVFWLYPWPWMPTTIDSGHAATWSNALPLDLGLIALFGLQHSLMVRPRFKRWLDRHIDPALQRAFYTVVSSLFLGAIILFWQPLPGRLWCFSEGSIGWWMMTIFYVIGWAVAVIATFLIDHFALLGLHQAWRGFRGIPEPKPTFQERGFYRFVRHPIQAGTLLGIWATPCMSMGHLLFALGFTLYILIGLYFEERDLVRTLGKEYEAYRQRVPMLFPFRVWERFG